MTIEELRARLAEIQEKATAIQATADAGKRALNPDEEKELEGLFEEFDTVEADIARRSKIEANGKKLGQPAGRTATPNPVNKQGTALDNIERIETPRSTAAERTRYGWKSFGDFAAAVKKACVPGGDVDQRLINAPSTYGSEAAGADGAFAIPPDFREAIMVKVMGEESLLSRCDQNPTSSNGITVPKDETAPWGTTGIQAYWTGEAGQYTQVKPVLQKSTIPVEKLTCLVPVTDELLDDAPALGAYVTRKAGDVIQFKVTDAIINGTGAGMPLGILAAPCTVSQAAEGSQAADTVHGLNLVKMWGRVPANWRSSAVWLCHPDVEPLLMTAGIQVGNPAASTMTGGSLIWMPPTGVSGQPYATLFGRPVIPTQACQAPGDVGDLILAAMGQYCAVLKSGGIRADSSIHLFFDYGLTAFRFTFRMGGQPWWSSSIAAKNGSGTYGPFVTLAAR